MTTRNLAALALFAALVAAPAAADHHEAAAADTPAAQEDGAVAVDTPVADEDGAAVDMPVAEEDGAAAVDKMPAEQGEKTAAAETPASRGSVARAQFALDVIDREPSDAIDRLENDHDRVLFFTDLREFDGQVVTHRWEFGGQIKAEVPLTVGAARWRAHSSKALDPSWLGTWTVSVVDAAGNVVAQENFDYVKASAPVATEEPAATDSAPASMEEAAE